MRLTMPDGGSLTWREAVDRHHLAVVDELTVRIDSEIQDAVARAIATEHTQALAELERTRAETRAATAAALNQNLRLLREASSQTGILDLLARASASYSGKAVVLSFENNQATAGELSFDISDAAAIRSAIEANEPVVALGSANEISSTLTYGMGVDAGQRVYLFPVTARQKAVAMLVAVGEVILPPLELLCGAAGMKLELLDAARAAPSVPAGPGLVQIGHESKPASSGTGPSAWEQLTPEDQKLHLQAQRVARVRVAEMRLYHAEALRRGEAARDIYKELRAEIESARSYFLQTFLSKTPTMVDYLHLEILHNLAHDDDRLLGQEYPGPMV